MISTLSFLNFISTSLSFLFQILLIKVFGAGLQTDVYYLSIAIVQFVPAIISGIIPMDLYIPVYNEIRVKQKEKADEFAGGIFVLNFLISIFLTLFIFIFSFHLVRIFATGFSYEKILFTSGLLKILSIHIIFHHLNLFLSSTLSANMHIKITYFTGIIPPLFNILALLLFSKIYGIKALIYAIVFSSFLNSFILSIYFFKKFSLKFLNPLFIKKEILYLLKNSFPFKAGGIIWELKTPILTNVLSYFPVGYITLFNYANKILSIIQGITNSPILHVLYLKVSIYLPQNRIKEIKEIFKSTLLANLFIFLIPVFLLSLIFKNIFILIFYPKVSVSQIEVMYHLFIYLIPYYFILSFESPFVQIIYGMKKGFKVLQVAIVYIILYSLFLLSFLKYFGVYALPLSLFFAQSYNAFSYSIFVNQRLKIVERDMVKNILQFSIFIIFLIILNNFFENNVFLKFLLSFILVIFLFLTARKERIYIFQYLFRSGEIK